ncbi:MAG: response regulator [Thermodesulfobacteriota bacterium]
MGRILVIDDDDQVRSMLRQTLEKDGHEVVEAPDGKAGLRLFQQSPPDLVITDIIMPEIGGIDTILALRAESPNLKIIAISGGGPGRESEVCLDFAERIGALKTLEKPIRQQALLDAVAMALGT